LSLTNRHVSFSVCPWKAFPPFLDLWARPEAYPTEEHLKGLPGTNICSRFYGLLFSDKEKENFMTLIILNLLKFCQAFFLRHFRRQYKLEYFFTNIRQDTKGLQGTTALAYLAAMSVTKKKFCHIDMLKNFFFRH
jgi:hypothetical protein